MRLVAVISCFDTTLDRLVIGLFMKCANFWEF